MLTWPDVQMFFDAPAVEALENDGNKRRKAYDRAEELSLLYRY